MLRDPSDPVVYEYLLQGQASADAYCLVYCKPAAHVIGDLGFSFDLPDTVSLWDIGVDYEYHGVVVIRPAFGAVCDETWARAVRPIGTGAVSSLGTTSIPGAEIHTKRAIAFDGQRSEQLTVVFGVNAPGKVSFPIDLWAESWRDFGGCGGGEVYSSLGQPSGLGSFSVDDDYFDPQDGLQVRLTFTPHLNLSGHTIESDLVLAEGETLGGFGRIYGDVGGLVGSAIINSGDLIVGNPFSTTGFNLAGDVAVSGGRLLLRDADAAVLGGHTDIRSTHAPIVTGNTARRSPSPEFAPAKPTECDQPLAARDHGSP